MLEFLQKLFDTSDFPARWHCGRWSEAHGWLHIGSDLAIFLAYMAIPVMLLYAMRRRLDMPVPLSKMLWLFVAFIWLCGLTHLNEAIIFWEPVYRWAGLTKLGTALVSLGTVAAAIPMIPALVALRTPAALEAEVERTTRALNEVELELNRRRRAEALFEVAVEASPSAMIATDLDGRIILLNAESVRLFGYEKQELLGRSIEVLVPTEQRQSHPWLQLGSGKMASRVGEQRSLEARRKDGTKFPIEVGLNPVEAHKVVLAAIIDRTEQYRQQRAIANQAAELSRSNEDLERFTYAVSHDLKAPIRAIQNAASWIREDLPAELLSADVNENLTLLASRVMRMEALLDGLLEYARAGATSEPAQEIDVADVIEDIVALLDPAPDVTISVPTSGATVRGAVAPLEQVLFNLISNAIKHRGEQALGVKVELADLGSFVEFSVADDGPGIDPAHHSKIFEVFQTLRPRDEFESTGIGLALVKKVVETQGGRVWVESTLGEGATFHFTWPKAPLSSSEKPSVDA